MADKVKITIRPKNGVHVGATERFFVSVNEEAHYIPYNTPTEVPDYVLEVMRRNNEVQVFTQEELEKAAAEEKAAQEAAEKEAAAAAKATAKEETSEKKAQSVEERSYGSTRR